MARANGLDNMSYADLLTLQEKVAAAIIARKAEDAKATKDQLRAYAEKAGFRLEELFGKRGSKGSGIAKYRNPKDASQTWTGRGRKPNWLIDAVKKGEDRVFRDLNSQPEYACDESISRVLRAMSVYQWGCRDLLPPGKLPSPGFGACQRRPGLSQDPRLFFWGVATKPLGRPKTLRQSS